MSFSTKKPFSTAKKFHYSNKLLGAKSYNEASVEQAVKEILDGDLSGLKR